jgi:hypothetical protein
MLWRCAGKFVCAQIGNRAAKFEPSPSVTLLSKFQAAPTHRLSCASFLKLRHEFETLAAPVSEFKLPGSSQRPVVIRLSRSHW